MMGILDTLAGMLVASSSKRAADAGTRLAQAELHRIQENQPSVYFGGRTIEEVHAAAAARKQQQEHEDTGRPAIVVIEDGHGRQALDGEITDVHESKDGSIEFTITRSRQQQEHKK